MCQPSFKNQGKNGFSTWRWNYSGVFWLIQCALSYTGELVKPETLSGVGTQVPVVKNERSIHYRGWWFSLVTLAGWWAVSRRGWQENTTGVVHCCETMEAHTALCILGLFCTYYVLTTLPHHPCPNQPSPWPVLRSCSSWWDPGSPSEPILGPVQYSQVVGAK